jgi:hypothetical protein
VSNFVLSAIVALVLLPFVMRLLPKERGPAPFCKECISDYGFGKGCQHRDRCISYKAWLKER